MNAMIDKGKHPAPLAVGNDTASASNRATKTGFDTAPDWFNYAI